MLNFWHSNQNTIMGIIGILGAAGVISAVVKALENWLSIQSKRVLTALVTTLSFIAVVAQSVITAASSSPKALGEHTFFMLGVATIIYQFVLKWASKVVADAQLLRAQRDGTVAAGEQVTIPVPSIEAAKQAIDEQIAPRGDF